MVNHLRATERHLPYGITPEQVNAPNLSPITKHRGMEG